MTSAKQKARGLLDPVNRSDQLPPTNIPSPSNYLPTNSATGSGYNTLAQVLAQGMSPGHPGTPQYYNQNSFMSPTGQLGGMAKYAPTSAMGAGTRGDWGESFWQQFLRNKGIDQAGNNQRLGGASGVNPGTSPGTNPVTNPGTAPGMPSDMSGWLQWLQKTYPGINFGAIMNSNLGGNAVNQPARSTMGGADLQSYLQMIQPR